MKSKNENVKTAIEIGTLAGQLTATHQSYVLNTINTLLFSQQANENAATEPKQEKDEFEKESTI